MDHLVICPYILDYVHRATPLLILNQLRLDLIKVYETVEILIIYGNTRIC